jgi:hypothetical protein
MKPSLLHTLLVVAISPFMAEAQVELRGRLVSAGGDPIPGATVLLSSVGYSVRSDSTGRFMLSGQPGATLVLFFTAPNFRRDSAAVVLPRGRAVERDFMMTSADAPAPEANLSATILRGRVVEESGVPLSYANVQVNYGTRFLADDSGRFQFPYEGGTRTLFVRRIGFEPVELRLSAKPDSALRVVLKPVAMQLKEVNVVAAGAAYRSLDTHGFYGRMRDAERGINHGFFVTPEDLERRKPNYITQMSEGLPAVRILGPNCGPRYGPGSDVICGVNGCKMTVYLDNIRVVGRLSGSDDAVNGIALPNHVAAMEIYPRGVTAPPQYQSQNGTCGVVLIWTK